MERESEGQREKERENDREKRRERVRDREMERERVRDREMERERVRDREMERESERGPGFADVLFTELLKGLSSLRFCSTLFCSCFHGFHCSF